MRIFNLIQESNVDGEIIVNVIPCASIELAQKAMDDGFILMSGLKSDMSGGLFIIKSDSIEKLESYYLANKTDNLYFSLLGDCFGNDKAFHEADKEIAEYGVKKARELNKKYKKEFIYVTLQDF